MGVGGERRQVGQPGPWSTLGHWSMLGPAGTFEEALRFLVTVWASPALLPPAGPGATGPGVA